MAWDNNLNKLTKAFVNDSNHPDLKFFLVNDFEYEIYSDFKKPEISWYFGSYLRFRYSFKTWISYLPTEKVDTSFENLKTILSYIENSYSIIEIVYFCKVIQKFILWSRKTKYRFINDYIKNYKISKKTNDILSSFYFQLEAFINFISNKNFDEEFIEDNNAQNEEPEDQPDDYKVRKMAENIRFVKDVLAFFYTPHPENHQRFAELENYNLIVSYTIDFIRTGEFKKPPKTVTHLNIDIGSIAYTYYLISKFVNGRKRRPDMFLFLVAVFDDLRHYEADVNFGWNKCYLYKHFQDEPKFYSQYNPFSLQIN